MAINTVALYAKICIKTIVMLFSTRIALNCLGASEYGLYNLIAGVIVLLSFVNGAFMISVQRYLSIAIGARNDEKLSEIFNASFSLHFLFAVVLGLLLFLIEPLLFSGFLNIPQESVDTAITVYRIMICSAMLTVIAIPYSAELNAHEDLAFFALTEVVVSVVQLLAAVLLLFISYNLLQHYTVMMILAVISGTVLKYVWCRKKYAEVKLVWSKLINYSLMKEMIGFVGWNAIGSSSVVVRNQGIAVLLNIVCGTIANATYGIANQVNSLVLTFATTLTAVFTPAIIQCHGANDNSKMRDLAIVSSKMSFLLSTVAALPVIVFIKEILEVWLGNYPEQTDIYCVCVIVAFVVTQTYPGINRAIYAIGTIKAYQIATSVCLLATIPAGYLCVATGLPAYSILIVLVVMQSLTILITAYYGYKVASFDFRLLLMKIFLPELSLFSLFTLGATIAKIQLFPVSGILSFTLTTIILILYSGVFYYIVFDSGERRRLSGIVKQIIRLK